MREEVFLLCKSKEAYLQPPLVNAFHGNNRLNRDNAEFRKPTTITSQCGKPHRTNFKPEIFSRTNSRKEAALLQTHQSQQQSMEANQNPGPIWQCKPNRIDVNLENTRFFFRNIGKPHKPTTITLSKEEALLKVQQNLWQLQKPSRTALRGGTFAHSAEQMANQEGHQTKVRQGEPLLQVQQNQWESREVCDNCLVPRLSVLLSGKPSKEGGNKPEDL